MRPGPKPRALEERFWEYVDKVNGPIHPIHGKCWVWLGTFGSGYGRMYVHNHGMQYAHRISFELAFGRISDVSDMWILHACDNPACVNPDHLFLGTSSDNQLDLEEKGIGRTDIPVNVGTANSACILTEEQVLEIRRRHRHGNGAALSREFNISESQLRRIVKGQSWKYL